MCGIAGYVSEIPQGPEVLASMTRALAHRGPDADGFHSSGPAHLGHRRLSVIDIEGSPQPMKSADDAVALVFNGEIYNFRELREELAARGYVFRTAGDTETVIAGWLAWGEDVVAHLRGMFAFALWDARTRTLFAARDHLGVKPFHYAWDGTTFVFGSEQKAVLAHPSVGAQLDHRIEVDAAENDTGVHRRRAQGHEDLFAAVQSHAGGADHVLQGALLGHRWREGPGSSDSGGENSTQNDES